MKPKPCESKAKVQRPRAISRVKRRGPRGEVSQEARAEGMDGGPRGVDFLTNLPT